MKLVKLSPKSLGLYTLVLCVVCVPTVLLAGPGAGLGPKGPGQALIHAEMMAQELGLDSVQRGQFEATFEQAREAVQPYVRELVSAKREMRDLIRADVFDESAIREKSAELSAAKTEMLLIFAKARNQVKTFLTPEQLEVFNKMGPAGRGRLSEMQ